MAKWWKAWNSSSAAILSVTAKILEVSYVIKGFLLTLVNWKHYNIILPVQYILLKSIMLFSTWKGIQAWKYIDYATLTLTNTLNYFVS